MIALFSGTPGSGKSLHLAKRIYDRLYARGLIICNFDLSLENCKHLKSDFVYVNNLDLTPGLLRQYSLNYSTKVSRPPKEGELLLVIDESQLLFNSRDWSKKDRSDWLEFFSQHRKFGYDIILVALFDRMLDRQIRSLVEYEFIHRKINNYGAIGSILGFLCFGSLFVSVKIWYPMKEKVGSEFFIHRKKYSSLYDTYHIFSGTKPAEDGVQGPHPIPALGRTIIK